MCQRQGPQTQVTCRVRNCAQDELDSLNQLVYHHDAEAIFVIFFRLILGRRQHQLDQFLGLGRAMRVRLERLLRDLVIPGSSILLASQRGSDLSLIGLLIFRASDVGGVRLDLGQVYARLGLGVYESLLAGSAL